MLDCEVDVDPELMDNLVITWAKDGEIIDITEGGEGNFRMKENNTLTIFSANEESSGSYTMCNTHAKFQLIWTVRIWYRI